MFKLNLTGGYFLFAALFLVNFAISLAVCGLYGTDVKHLNKEGSDVDSKWVFAVVVGALSAVTCVVFWIPRVIQLGSFIVPIWNGLLFILWIALFGTFASKFLHAKAHGNSDVQRMKNAVWVDLAGAILWLFTAIVTLVYWTRHRGSGLTRYTGRATTR